MHIRTGRIELFSRSITPLICGVQSYSFYIIGYCQRKAEMASGHDLHIINPAFHANVIVKQILEICHGSGNFGQG
jgi:hypothetical protein